MKALDAVNLHLNPAKCAFYLLEVDFLGHHISARGIEPNSSKVEKILNWPVPKNATDVCAFLGLVRYVATFLPKLADHTTVLTPLTTKDAQNNFPLWTAAHQYSLDSIKALVVSSDCLTVIDHEHPGDNKIIVTCDASDWCTGAVLSFGPTWEMAWPVAYDSMQLKAAEKNYPIHEKELLAVVRALKKWRSDLLGSAIYVYTDHKTLENFNSQKDLSCRNTKSIWFTSQVPTTWLLMHCHGYRMILHLQAPCYMRRSAPVGAVLAIATDQTVLDAIKAGYASDGYCLKIASSSMPGSKCINGLWYVGDCLLIPRTGNIRKNLF
jgi:hypothetical protein